MLTDNYKLQTMSYSNITQCKISAKSNDGKMSIIINDIIFNEKNTYQIKCKISIQQINDATCQTGQISQTYHNSIETVCVGGKLIGNTINTLDTFNCDELSDYSNDVDNLIDVFIENQHFCINITTSKECEIHTFASIDIITFVK